VCAVQERMPLKGHAEDMGCLVMSPGGPYMVSGVQRGRLRVLDLGGSQVSGYDVILGPMHVGLWLRCSSIKSTFLVVNCYA